MSQSQKFKSQQSGNVYLLPPELAARLGGLHPVPEEVATQPPSNLVKADPKTKEKISSKEGK